MTTHPSRAHKSIAGWVSWALFEWARNPYVLLVTIYVFAPYFATEVVGDPVRGQALLGDANKYAGLAIAILAPFAGAIADKSGRRKPWIAVFVLLMTPAMAALWFSSPDGPLDTFGTLACIVVIAMCFEFGAVFHNAMLPSTAPSDRIGYVSGLAIALGNLAGLALMVGVLIGLALPGEVDWPFVPSEPWFGIDQSRFEDDRIVGPLAAVWFLLFSLPLFLFTRDGTSTLSVREAVARGLSEVGATMRRLRHYRNIALYLVARMLFNDGMVGVLIFGGVYAAGMYGWDTIHMLIFGIVLSFVAAAGGLLGGFLDDRLGSKRTIILAVGGTTVLLGVGVSITPDTLLLVIPYDRDAPPIWSLPYFDSLPEALYVGITLVFAMFITTAFASSRTMLARLAPTSMVTQFFGLYALSGAATAFLAPLLVAELTERFHSQRIGYASLIILLSAGLLLFLPVREERAPASPE